MMTSLFISAADVILQVLTSTGTYSYPDRGSFPGTWEVHPGFRQQGYYGVLPGVNGPWDRLPKGWGLGIPLSNIDFDQIRNFTFQVGDEAPRFVTLDQLIVRDLSMSLSDT